MDCSRPFRARIAHHQTINITDIFEMIAVCPNIQGNFSEGPDYSCKFFFFFFFFDPRIILNTWHLENKYLQKMSALS